MSREAAKQAPLTRGPTRPRRQISRGIGFMGGETQQLWKAHEAAKKGKQVELAVATRQRANYLLQRLKSMGFGCIVQFEDKGRTIVYPGGGRLVFKTP